MKFKLPFGKSADDADEIGPDNGLSDNLDYLAPSKFQQKLPWISVALGYLVFIGAIAGTIGYLTLNADDIEDEMRADRPSLRIEKLKVQLAAQSGEPSSAEPQIAETSTDEVDPVVDVSTQGEDNSDGEENADITQSAEAEQDQVPTGVDEAAQQE